MYLYDVYLYQLILYFRLEPEKLVMNTPPPGYEYEDEDLDEDKDHQDKFHEFDLLPKQSDSILYKHFYVMTLVPMLCIAALSIVLVIVLVVYRKSKKNYMYGANARSVMTFSNPNYYTSNNEANPCPSNPDKKPFLWKRLKYDKSQVSNIIFYS